MYRFVSFFFEMIRNIIRQLFFRQLCLIHFLLLPLSLHLSTPKSNRRIPRTRPLHSDEDYEELSKKYNTCVKRFLFDIDFINYFERILANYDKFLKGRLMRVSGEWTFEYSAQKDAIYKKFVPNRIEYCHDEDPVQVIALKVPFIFKVKKRRP